MTSIDARPRKRKSKASKENKCLSAYSKFDTPIKNRRSANTSATFSDVTNTLAGVEYDTKKQASTWPKSSMALEMTKDAAISASAENYSGSSSAPSMPGSQESTSFSDYPGFVCNAGACCPTSPSPIVEPIDDGVYELSLFSSHLNRRIHGTCLHSKRRLRHSDCPADVLANRVFRVGKMLRVRRLKGGLQVHHLRHGNHQLYLIP